VPVAGAHRQKPDQRAAAGTLKLDTRPQLVKGMTLTKPDNDQGNFTLANQSRRRRETEAPRDDANSTPTSRSHGWDRGCWRRSHDDGQQFTVTRDSSVRVRHYRDVLSEIVTDKGSAIKKIQSITARAGRVMAQGT